jgi:hypothetical protein
MHEAAAHPTLDAVAHRWQLARSGGERQVEASAASRVRWGREGGKGLGIGVALADDKGATRT